MTDGAAQTLLSSDQTLPEVQEAFSRLTSRDPKTFWTSGQWMTEKRGGKQYSFSMNQFIITFSDQVLMFKQGQKL